MLAAACGYGGAAFVRNLVVVACFKTGGTSRAEEKIQSVVEKPPH